MPPLDLVSSDESAEVRNKAVEVFKRELVKFDQIPHSPARFKSSLFFAHRDAQIALTTKGYTFGVSGAGRIYRVELWKNDHMIAAVDSENSHKPNYLATALYNHVVADTRGVERGVSCIKVVISNVGLNEMGDYPYETFYSDIFRSSVDKGRANLEEFCKPIARFLSSIEPNLSISKESLMDIICNLDIDTWQNYGFK